MTEHDGGAGSPAPLHFKAEGKRGRGASLFTIQIYDVVLDAGDEGLTVAGIHDRFKDDPSFRTDTAAWWQKSKSKDTLTQTFEIDRAGRKRVVERVHAMCQLGLLKSDGTTGRGRRARYVAAEPPKGYRPKWRRQNPYGYYPIDVKAAREASERQRDRMVLIQQAKSELAKQKPRKLAPLLAEALRLLEAE